jgi:hypothetical protein
LPSVRCVNSLTETGATGGASTGFGIAGAVGALLMRVMSSRASCSSTSRRCAATAISPPAPALGSTGIGVLARRFASVLPPPSRLACARMSATTGLVFDFAFTSATSSGGCGPGVSDRTAETGSRAARRARSTLGA